MAFQQSGSDSSRWIVLSHSLNVTEETVDSARNRVSLNFRQWEYRWRGSTGDVAAENRKGTALCQSLIDLSTALKHRLHSVAAIRTPPTARCVNCVLQSGLLVCVVFCFLPTPRCWFSWEQTVAPTGTFWDDVFTMSRSKVHWGSWEIGQHPGTDVKLLWRKDAA